MKKGGLIRGVTSPEGGLLRGGDLSGGEQFSSISLQQSPSYKFMSSTMKKGGLIRKVTSPEGGLIRGVTSLEGGLLRGVTSPEGNNLVVFHYSSPPLISSCLLQ